MDLGHAQALAPDQVVHDPGRDQNQGQDRSLGRGQDHVSDPHLAQNHHSLLNRYVSATQILIA